MEELLSLKHDLESGRRTFSHITGPDTRTHTHTEHPEVYSSTLQMTTVKVLTIPRDAVNPAQGFVALLCHRVIYLNVIYI